MGYTTIEALRAAGITEAMLSDEDAPEKIDYWSSEVDRLTGQFFESREVDTMIDGSGGAMLLFRVPIISISAIYRNDSTVAEDPANYVVYNRRQPDDRKNPKIVLKNLPGGSFCATGGARRIFQEGVQNQRVVGTFGYTEEGGETPLPIARAVILLIANDLETLADPDREPAGVSQRIKREVTDGHSITYAGVSDAYTPTGIPEVDKIIRRFKAPIHMRMIK